MKDIGIFTLLTVIVSAAAPAAPDYNPTAPAAPEYRSAKTFFTARSADQFAACFAGAEESAGLPWSFVPKDNGGGTFSNVGARSGVGGYFLVVSDRGSGREVRLEGDGAAISRAVSQCV